jgi:hypothetical protein
MATINDKEVGAQFFWEDLQGKAEERAEVITKPQGEESKGCQRQVWSTRCWSHDMHD